MLTLKLAIVPLMMSQILAMDTQGRVKLNLWILHNLLGKGTFAPLIIIQNILFNSDQIDFWLSSYIKNEILERDFKCTMILLKDALLQFFKSPILKVYSLTCCRSESLATLFDEAEETPEPVEQDLGEPVTEEPSWGVRQKGGTQK